MFHYMRQPDHFHFRSGMGAALFAAIVWGYVRKVG